MICNVKFKKPVIIDKVEAEVNDMKSFRSLNSKLSLSLVQFNCTETCPDHAPHKIIQEVVPGEKVTVCVKDDGSGLE